MIILAAGPSKKMRSYGARSLLKIKKRPLIRHQIDSIKKLFPKAEILCLLGFESELIYKEIHNEPVKTLFFNDYARFHSYQSVLYAVRAITNKKCIIIHGDIYFPDNALAFKQDTSTLVLSKQPKDSIGVVVSKDGISHMSYGMNDFWQKITYLNEEACEIVRNMEILPSYWNRFDWELYNHLMDRDIKFVSHTADTTEINTSKDLINANSA